MKATGIVRRIDDLGRVVIPKEIRRTLRIREGDPLEIYVDQDGEIILKKYSPIGELSGAVREYAEALHESLGHLILISDRDRYVAAAGSGKKAFLEKPIGPLVEQSMDERRMIRETNAGEYEFVAGEREPAVQFVVVPIVAAGDPIGAVVAIARGELAQIGELDLKVLETTAGFLAKQMEG
ncbi:MAG: stage V sporulation protein T [Hydrogenibacillus schlegelii]|uniref:Stage V sporulation protein T n=1 Tax=Hydrogenibacillus schlegelii TaxID=1484 RepID=A0A947GBE0_HYDSH|nr:stage V sporulation protein T [Hydrogenibacillus schlegelii]MBT9282039.1 stage V sporulation protein T [Hydrogenibacillus schlegelii]